MVESYLYVDLGTKKAGALTVARKRGHIYGFTKGRAVDCLGVDLKSEYRDQVKSLGYRFCEADVLNGFAWPSANYYLAFDFLEHLPSVEDSMIVLKKMCEKATHGIWLRLPSFEPDTATGEGALRKHGLRFAWTHWKGHPSPFLVEHAMGVILETLPPDSYILRHKKLKKITSSRDQSVVPISAPIDTVKYHPRLGPKPHVKFNPPLIGQHEIIVTKRKE